MTFIIYHKITSVDINFAKIPRRKDSFTEYFIIDRSCAKIKAKLVWIII